MSGDFHPQTVGPRKSDTSPVCFRGVDVPPPTSPDFSFPSSSFPPSFLPSSEPTASAAVVVDPESTRSQGVSPSRCHPVAPPPPGSLLRPQESTVPWTGRAGGWSPLGREGPEVFSF